MARKGKFEKEECRVPVDIAGLEKDADYFIYFYSVGGCSKVVLSESIPEGDRVRVCNEVIDALIDLKRDLGSIDKG